MPKKKTWITSVFRLEGMDHLQIEFDAEDPGKCFLKVENSDGLHAAREVRELLQAFEDKYPFAFEEKKD